MINRLSKLGNLKDAHINKQEMGVLKHRILAEISRRQDERDVLHLTFSESLRYLGLRVARKIIPTHQKVIVSFLIVVMMVSTTFIAQAAVPGDVLWPVKITIENAEVAFAIDSAYESRVHLRHVDNRLRELTIIVAQSGVSTTKNNNISKLVRRLEKDITAANQSLKISKAEKKDTEPEIIMSLAKDLSNKASEAAHILEVNKMALATEEYEAALLDGSFSATSTEVFSGGGSSETSTDVLLGSLDSENKSPANELAKVIAEVQVIHVDVSYSALESMIEMVEQERATNRSEVTAMMGYKVHLLKQDLEKPKDIVGRITNDFILHRQEIKSLITKSEILTQEASGLLVLDNLSGAYRKAVAARKTIEEIQPLIAEVVEAGGVTPKPEPVKPVPVVPVVPSVSDPTVTIQTIGDHVTSTGGSILPEEGSGALMKE